MLSNSDFSDLHVHSSYSLLDGSARPEVLAEETAKLGRKHLAITDHGSVDGWIKHAKACEKFGLLPSFGIELYMLEDFEGRTKKVQKNLHLTAIAKNEEGLKKLIAACGYAHGEGMGKWGLQARPFLPMDYPLKEGWAGNVIISTGCASSPFWNAENGSQLLASYAETFQQDLYAEVMPIYDWEDQRKINSLALDAGKRFGIKPIVTTDIHYLKKDDCEFHDVIIGLSQKGKTVNSKRWSFESHCSHIHTTAQLYESFTKLGFPEETIEAVIKNTREVTEKSCHVLKSSPVQLPNVLGCSTEEEEYERFVGLVLEGYDRLRLEGSEYVSRLDYEINVIKGKGFIRYFLLVSDTIRWAKANGIFVGPARGSVGGSLVAYCLGITNLDPIKYRLYFERFLDPNRKSLPDIDIDIEDRNRHLVEAYLREKYGSNNVAHVSTFGTMRGKGAIKDVGRFFEVPLEAVDKMSGVILHRHESDDRASQTIEDTIASQNSIAVEFAEKYPKVVKYAQQLEGLIRSYGIHASGYVIANEDLSKSSKCYLVNRHEKVSVNWDGKDIEYMGFVKLDLLGLANLSVLAEATDLIFKRHGIRLDMTEIPLTDKKTYEMVSRGETVTLFQIGTPGIMKYCKELKPDNFEHLAAITALWRPGPMQSGGTEKYKNVKLGLEKPHYYNPAYKEITEISYGELIYQEQITQLLMKLAGYTYAEADEVRKIVAKKLGPTEWAKHTDKFIDGCLRLKSLDRQTATDLWASLSIFALYAFNRAHSVGYGMLAYWTAYLKANYPAEWMCAYLNYANTDKEDKKTGEVNIDVVLREVKRMGLKIRVPDINKSDVQWTVGEDGSLRVGLKDIAFVGETAQAQIAKMKAVGTIRTFQELTTAGDALNKRVIKAMLYTGALDELSFEGFNKHRLMVQFDDYFDKLGMPVALPKFLKTPIPEVDLPELIAKNRFEFLRFNPENVGRSMTMHNVSKILGVPCTDNEDGEQLVLGFNQTQVEACQMPGTGIRLVRGTEGNWAKFRSDTKACNACTLRKSCKAPVPITPGALDIMIIGEHPNRDDDGAGKPFAGPQRLWNTLKKFGIDRDMVCVTQAVHCKPSDKAKPTPDQYKGCPWLEKEIGLIKPKFILSIGNGPLNFLRGAEKGIMSLNAKTEWNNKVTAWVTYVIGPGSIYYHPEQAPLFEAGIQEFARAITQFA